MQTPQHYMRLALLEAQQALGRTTPNPAVGAVIVRDNTVLATGFHHQAGLPHAEIDALNKLSGQAPGADLYVTLEPCNHQGRTGPCTQAIIAAQIKRVFVGMRDPNPEVVGHGIESLRAAGIEVHTGILEAECQQLNEAFVFYIQYKRPFVVAKLAQSLDGKVATRTGASQWITNAKARERGHALRNIYDAILVGIGTVQADDPELTCRIPNGRDPTRVIVDALAQTPPSAKVVKRAAHSQAPTLIAVTNQAPQERVQALIEQGAQIMVVQAHQNRALMKHLFKCLAERELTSVLVEGGPRILGACFDARLVNKVHAFVAPLIIGGEQAKSSVLGHGISQLTQGHQLQHVQTEMLDDNLLITGTTTADVTPL